MTPPQAALVGFHYRFFDFFLKKKAHVVFEGGPVQNGLGHGAVFFQASARRDLLAPARSCHETKHPGKVNTDGILPSVSVPPVTASTPAWGPLEGGVYRRRFLTRSISSPGSHPNTVLILSRVSKDT